MIKQDDVYELEERINSLRMELLSYGQEIMQHLTSLYTNKLPADKHFDLKQSENPFNVLKILRQEVTDILEESKLKTEFFNKVYYYFVLKCIKLMLCLTSLEMT